MANLNTILCIKWGTLFSAEEVNVLFRACSHNMAEPIRFVCLCDTNVGLDPLIEARPIPDIGLGPQDWRRPGVWRKLSLYHKDLHDLDRVLFIDLDMVVVGPLEPFFEVQEGVTFLDTGPKWRPVPRRGGQEAGTGIFSFDPKLEAGVLAAFQADPNAAMESYANEQDFASAHSTGVAYWPQGRVLSFKRHLCYRNGVGLLRKPIAPPATASVIAFHGNPRPSDTRSRLIWGPAPNWHLGRVPWIEKYFSTYATE